MTWTTNNAAIVESWGLRGSYQARAIDALAVSPRGVLIAPAGSGKTIMMARSLEAVLRQSTPPVNVLWLANTRDQLDQAVNALRLLEPLRNCFRAWIRTPAGCETLELDLIDTLIVDECFPSGTLVDGKPIETICVGDEVNAFDHRTGEIMKARVRATMRRSAPKFLLRVMTHLGRQFVCTPNHPIFLPELRCYSPALELKCGDMVLTYNAERNHGKNQKCNMQGLRQDLFCDVRPGNVLKGVRDHSPVEAQKAGRDSFMPRVRSPGSLRHERSSRCVQAWKSLLLKRLHEGILREGLFVDNVANKLNLRLGADEESESNEARGRAEEGINKASRNVLGTSGARRQREGTDEVAGLIGVCPWMGNGIRDCDCAPYVSIRETFAEPLQDRYCMSGAENSDRGGWKQSQHDQGARERSTQECLPFADWVESLEVLESGNRRGYGALCTDGFVYNLEVEEYNNYFVDGVLVHNCHHAAAASWAAVIRSCINARTVWGMTATGHREDGEWPAVESLIGPVVCEITKAEVAGDGFAVPARVEWVVPGQLDQHKEAVRHLVEDVLEGENKSMFEDRYHRTRCNAVMSLAASIGSLGLLPEVFPAEDQKRARGFIVMNQWRVPKWQGMFDKINSLNLHPDAEVAIAGQWTRIIEGIKAQCIQQMAVKLVISENQLRNDLAAHHCYQAVLWGESVLCLVYSVEQGEYIAAAVGGALVHSKLGKKLRRERIAAFRDGSVKCLVSTSLADEGLDVPIASTLVMACGGRGMSKALDQDGKKRTTAKIEQRTARVLRPVPGKDEALIVDFFDWQHPMMLGASWTRRKGYAELGFRQRVPDEIVEAGRKAKDGRNKQQEIFG